MPGPRPTHCPKFPEEFLEQARIEASRRTAEYRSVQRSQLVLLLHQYPNIEHEEAGEYVGLSGDQVRRWRRRWAAGDFSIDDTKGRGRKTDFSPTRASNC